MFVVSDKLSTDNINPSTGDPYGVIGNYVANAIFGVRPVVNLKSDVLIDYGLGTKNNPYVVS